MPPDFFDRRRLKFRPLSERKNKVNIERDHVAADSAPAPLSAQAQSAVVETADRLKRARETGAACILVFGAHTIKNGLSPVLIRLIEEGWVTHLATNGAGVIHDWEFAYLGESSEDVRENLATGEFGAWEETGFYVNLAINLGAFDGLGYGESVGRMIQGDVLDVPSEETLERAMREGKAGERDRAAAAADLLDVVTNFEIDAGRMPVPHPFKRFSIQAAAYRLGIPFTGHPMFGHDIIYEHPMSQGASIGRTAERDFLAFAHSVSQLDGGVYLSVGSAVMSPMIFEKTLSMARNAARRDASTLEDIYISVVDLATSDWDWAQGEPPEDDPAYYLRYNKTFARAGATFRYIQANNRDFLLALYQALSSG